MQKANAQEEIRKKLQDLKSTLTISNNNWDSWETEFIEEMVEKLDRDLITLSFKQHEKVNQLWEAI